MIIAPKQVMFSLLVLTAVFLEIGEAINCSYYSDGFSSSYCSSSSFTNCFSEYYSGSLQLGCTYEENKTFSECANRRNVACIQCNTDNCNSIAPSEISCYKRYGSNSDVAVTNCVTGFRSCFSSSTGTFFESGCGRCNASISQNCMVCNTNLCNSQTSSISCYYRSASLATYSSPGTSVACYGGISSCFSYSSETVTIADCGSCSTEKYGSCVTCNTSLCNTHLPSAISCYNRNGTFVLTSPYTFVASNGTVTPCSTGVTTCYSYSVASSGGFSNSYAGCGVCNSTTTARYDCKTCSTVNCNYAFADYSTPGKSSSWLGVSETGIAAAAVMMLVLMKLS